MRIGILTFHRAINYGAILQCFSLFSTLKYLGHDVEIIDYRPESIEHDRSHFVYRDFKKKSIYKKVTYILSCLLQFFSKKRVTQIFNSFIRENLVLSNVAYKGEDIKGNYDAILFGSDQIWSPEMCFKLDDVYCGQFSHKNAKFISYAASVGKIEHINGFVKEQFGNNLAAFDSISVREQNLYEFIRKEYKLKVDIVCDPSFLCPRSFFESMTIPVGEKNYVLLILMIPSSEKIRFAKNIAKQMNAELIRMYGIRPSFFKFDTKVKSELTPYEYLSYIRYAKCIITDSFHGTAFSIIMHNNFYVFRRKTNNARSETLLNIVGLSERMIDSNALCRYQDVDYSNVDEHLETYKLKSIQYLKDSLSK